MKKIVLAALFASILLGSCSSSGLLSSGSKTTSSISKIADVASTVNEIVSLANSLGLSNTQQASLTGTLSSYITKYQQLSTAANEATQLSSLKSSTLSSISSSLGTSKYNSFLGLIKTATTEDSPSSSTLSSGAISVLSSLL